MRSPQLSQSFAGERQSRPDRIGVAVTTSSHSRHRPRRRPGSQPRGPRLRPSDHRALRHVGATPAACPRSCLCTGAHPTPHFPLPAAYSSWEMVLPQPSVIPWTPRLLVEPLAAAHAKVLFGVLADQCQYRSLFSSACRNRCRPPHRYRGDACCSRRPKDDHRRPEPRTPNPEPRPQAVSTPRQTAVWTDIRIRRLACRVATLSRPPEPLPELWRPLRHLPTVRLVDADAHLGSERGEVPLLVVQQPHRLAENLSGVWRAASVDLVLDARFYVGRELDRHPGLPPPFTHRALAAGARQCGPRDVARRPTRPGFARPGRASG